MLGPSSPWEETYFSAVCLSFGISVAQRRNIPVGLISAATGGATIEYFMDQLALDKCGRGHGFDHRGLMLGPIPPSGGKIWSNIIAPLTHMPIRAFVFYQVNAATLSSRPLKSQIAHPEFSIQGRCNYPGHVAAPKITIFS